MSIAGNVDIGALRNIHELSGSLAQRVYQSLQEAVLSLDLPPGTVLRKGAICEQLGVSRSPVAEAISRLATEGLVEVIPQSATRVTRFSMAKIREGAFLREALEVAAAAKVATDHTDEQVSKLARNLRLQALLVEDKEYLEFYHADEEFHSMLIAFTGYKRLAPVMASVTLQVSRARMILLPTPGRIAETVKEHKAVLDAIRASNPEKARQAMRKHLSQMVARLEPLEQERPDLFEPG